MPVEPHPASNNFHLKPTAQDESESMPNPSQKNAQSATSSTSSNKRTNRVFCISRNGLFAETRNWRCNFANFQPFSPFIPRIFSCIFADIFHLFLAGFFFSPLYAPFYASLRLFWS